MIDQILTQLLYACSGFLLAVSTCRYSVLAIRSSRRQLAAGKKQPALLHTALAAIFISLSWVGLPLFLYSRNQTAGFVFIAALLFFFSRAHRNGSLKP